MNAAQCFRTDDHEAHVWGQYQGDKYTKQCLGRGREAEALQRNLARARVAAFITAPSWVRSPYAGQQAEQILHLVLDTEPCMASRQNPLIPTDTQVCYREDGHNGRHFADGGYAWDDQDEIDRSIEEHDRMLDSMEEDR